MNTKTTRGRKEDKSKVAAGQDEVQYEKDKLHVSSASIKDAIKSGGNSRKGIEKKLSN